MGKAPTRLRNADVVAVMRHMADVAALKADPVAQRQHLIDGLNALVGTRVGWMFVADDWRPGRRPVIRHQVLASDPDPMFLTYMAEFGVKVPLEAEPYADHALRDGSEEQTWVKDQVFSIPDARVRYAPSMHLYDGADLTDGLVSLYRDGPARDRIVGVALHRLHGGAKLTARERLMVRLAVVEMKHLARRGHLPLAPPDDPPLPPRLQQVKERMLRGAGVKRVARELGLSVWTVREHVQRLYKHYGVNSREELMAKFVRP